MDASKLPNVSDYKNGIPFGGNYRKRGSGGLGSSHTIPCGTAVPARPPTHRFHILKIVRKFNNGPIALRCGVLGS